VGYDCFAYSFHPLLLREAYVPIGDDGSGSVRTQNMTREEIKGFPTFAPNWLLLGSLFPTLRTFSSSFSPLNASFFDRVLSSDRTRCSSRSLTPRLYSPANVLSSDHIHRVLDYRQRQSGELLAAL
jgi:hypothetical protein